MKIVSQLNHEGYFVGATHADESPLEPGVFHIPGGAIDEPPPTIPLGKIARWQGESWDFVDPPAEPEDEPLAEAGVPQVVTMRQARLALLDAGLLAQVDVAIASLPSPQREAASIEWEYAQDVRRASPLVLMLADALNLSEQALDGLFTTAAAL